MGNETLRVPPLIILDSDQHSSLAFANEAHTPNEAFDPEPS